MPGSSASKVSCWSTAVLPPDATRLDLVLAPNRLSLSACWRFRCREQRALTDSIATVSTIFCTPILTQSRGTRRNFRTSDSQPCQRCPPPMGESEPVTHCPRMTATLPEVVYRRIVSAGELQPAAPSESRRSIRPRLHVSKTTVLRRTAASVSQRNTATAV